MVIPTAFTRPGGTPIADGRPVAGLLDVSLPWQVLIGISPGPGYLGRIGPITASQARRLAAAADAAAGGCAHTTAGSAYRPPLRLKEYIAARDLTCRFLRCRQPAWRGDLDHTIPFDDGGMTCRCNLGGLWLHSYICPLSCKDRGRAGRLTCP
jgi:hypothetical protein